MNETKKIMIFSIINCFAGNHNTHPVSSPMKKMQMMPFPANTTESQDMISPFDYNENTDEISAENQDMLSPFDTQSLIESQEDLQWDKTDTENLDQMLKRQEEEYITLRKKMEQNSNFDPNTFLFHSDTIALTEKHKQEQKEFDQQINKKYK